MAWWIICVLVGYACAGTVAAQPLVVAALDWRVDDDHYVSHQQATKLANLLELGLAETEGYQWVERVALTKAAEEMSLSRVSADPATWLRVGLWVSADLLVTGRVETVSDGWRLYGQVIDVERADVLASWVSTIKAEEDTEKDGPLDLGGLDADEWLQSAQRAMKEAKRVYTVSRNQVAVAALFFENQTSVGRRIDHLEFKLDEVLEQVFAKNDHIRLLRFPGAQVATDEYELVLSGLADGGAGASRRLADVYLWGTYREVDWEGVPFREVSIEFTLMAWNGQGEPVQTVYQGTAGEMDDLIVRVTSGAAAWVAEQPHADPQAIDTAVSKRISETLAGRAKRLQAINRGGEDTATPAYLHRWRRAIRQLEMAFFFDPSNASLHHEMIAERWRRDLSIDSRVLYAERWRRAALDAEIHRHIERFGYGTSWPVYHRNGWASIYDNRMPGGQRMSEAAIYSARNVIYTGQGLRGTPKDIKRRSIKLYQTIALRRVREVLELQPDYASLNAALSLRFRNRPGYAVEMIELAWPRVDKAVSPGDYQGFSRWVNRAYEKAGHPDRANELLDQLHVIPSEPKSPIARKPNDRRLPDDTGPFSDTRHNLPSLLQLSPPLAGMPPMLNPTIKYLSLPKYDYHSMQQIWRLDDSLWVNLTLYNHKRGSFPERNTWRYSLADQKWHGTKGWIRVNRWVKHAVSAPAFDPDAVWLVTERHSVGRVSADGTSRVFGPINGLTSTRFRSIAVADDRLIFVGGEHNERAQLNMYLPAIDDWIAVVIPEQEEITQPIIENIAVAGRQVLLIGDYHGISPAFLRYDMDSSKWVTLKKRWLTHIAEAPDAQPMRPIPIAARFKPDVLLADTVDNVFWVGSFAGLTRYKPINDSFRTWFAHPPHHPDDPPKADKAMIRHFGAITAMAALPNGRYMVVATESRRSRRGLINKPQEDNYIGAYLFVFDRVAGKWSGYVELDGYTPVSQLLVDGPTLWMITDGQNKGIAHIKINELISLR